MFAIENKKDSEEWKKLLTIVKYVDIGNRLEIKESYLNFVKYV